MVVVVEVVVGGGGGGVGVQTVVQIAIVNE